MVLMDVFLSCVEFFLCFSGVLYGTTTLMSFATHLWCRGQHAESPSTAPNQAKTVFGWVFGRFFSSFPVGAGCLELL